MREKHSDCLCYLVDKGKRFDLQAHTDGQGHAITTTVSTKNDSNNKTIDCNRSWQVFLFAQVKTCKRTFSYTIFNPQMQMLKTTIPNISHKNCVWTFANRFFSCYFSHFLFIRTTNLLHWCGVECNLRLESSRHLFIIIFNGKRIHKRKFYSFSLTCGAHPVYGFLYFCVKQTILISSIIFFYFNHIEKGSVFFLLLCTLSAKVVCVLQSVSQNVLTPDKCACM